MIVKLPKKERIVIEAIKVAPNEWEVVNDGDVIGRISGFDLLGSWKYAANFRGNALPGPFNGHNEALQAIKKASEKEQN